MRIQDRVEETDLKCTHLQMQSSSVLSLSPSFNTYSSSNLADIATRVVQEFRNEFGSDFEDMYGLQEGEEEKLNDRDRVQTQVIEEDEEEGQEARENFEEDEKDDFEFPSVCSDPIPAISADEIFYKGQIRPVFPIFGRDLLFPNVEDRIGKVDCCKPPTHASIRMSLRKLMSEDRDPPSCSSSETDELDGVPAGTYCVWTPKTAADVESTRRCKKSNSTGTSKRWRFRDLIHRSNSDGKDTFVFLSSSNADAKNDGKADTKETTEKCSGESKVAGKVKPNVIAAGECVPVMAVREATQVRRKVAAAAAKDGDRRGSFPPYRQDLIGLFANVNGLSRNLHPF
ncbi:hypothetical protein U1Q18_007280 [Sarracenia purpurea var. burkii]